MGRLITSESVACGHPDKVSDQISDAILDALLEQDPHSKVAVETMVKDNTVVLGGEVTTTASINYEKVVKDVVSSIGYNDANHGFYWKNLTVLNLIGEQSPEINGAVVGDDLGAGDQGFMVGFASNDTDNKMPLGIHMSKKIVDSVITTGGLGPDAKSQVTIEEMEDGSKRVHTILVSTMHNTSLSLEEVREIITKSIKNNQVGLSDSCTSLIDDDTKIIVNPAGSWNVGGPVSDCGLTGRKIVVDQYGPYCPVGGGAFSGKDASKVDRSAAYLARYIAKNIVSAGFANQCKVELAYMIGVAEPASLNIDTFGYSDDLKLVDVVRKIFPMTPSQIVNHFDLTKPMYLKSATGHFGNDELPWEKVDMVEELKNQFEETQVEV